MNEPEEYRDVEKRAEAAAAEMAEMMIRVPRLRWAIMPIYRLMKWCGHQAQKARREDGWL